MQRVSFQVAKALKEAGYPQDEKPIIEIGWYNKAGIYTKQLPAFWKGDNMFVAVAPTYLDVWLWLWREKKYSINVDCHIGGKWSTDMSMKDYSDPEEAIAVAIEYLAENDLISKV